MRKLTVAAACVIFLLVLLGANTLRQAGHWDIDPGTPAEQEALLAPFWQFERPETPGPHPLALLLSGCDGVRDNMGFWASMLRERGWATLILDSHSPRNLDGMELWRLVCAGQMLGGPERAGDVAVALAALRDDPGLTEEVMLFGASHGGWTALEVLNLANSGEVPPGLTEWPIPPQDILRRLGRLALLYPYCGQLNRTGETEWRVAPPVLMILAEEDSVISTPACLEIVADMQARGNDVQVGVLAGADHGFDQSIRSPLSSLTFDQALSDKAAALIEAFLHQTQVRAVE